MKGGVRGKRRSFLGYWTQTGYSIFIFTGPLWLTKGLSESILHRKRETGRRKKDGPHTHTMGVDVLQKGRTRLSNVLRPNDCWRDDSSTLKRKVIFGHTNSVTTNPKDGGRTRPIRRTGRSRSRRTREHDVTFPFDGTWCSFPVTGD